MPATTHLFQKSTFFENLLEHRFIHDLSRHYALEEEPRFLNVLRSDVDMFGIDLVLALDDEIRHVQLKTRSGKPPPKPYDVSELVWRKKEGCVIWIRYDPKILEPIDYSILGFPLPPLNSVSKAKRKGFRKVKMQSANHRQVLLPGVAGLLFPKSR